MNLAIVEQFKAYFSELNLSDLETINDFYSENILFQDPLHEIQGRENVREYFEKLNQNLISGAFTFTDEAIKGNTAFLQWEMNLQLKRPKKKIQVSGISVLTIDQKITSHQDYFDAGALFYEHVPILGGLIRFLKRKIAN